MKLWLAPGVLALHHKQLMVDSHEAASHLLWDGCTPGTHEADGSAHHCRPYTCDGDTKVFGLHLRERREIHDWSDEEFAAFRTVFRSLMEPKRKVQYPHHFGFDGDAAPELKGDNHPHYMAFTELHLHSTKAHASDNFLPWHRRFMADLETQLQVMAANCSVTLPYWNWAYESRNFADSKVWTPERYGSWTPGCLQDGIGEGFALEGTCVTRDPVLNKTALAMNFPSWSYVTQKFKEEARFSEMNTLLDNHLGHNCFHCTVDGDLHALTSTRDPVFWLHHGMIDRMYYHWQQLHSDDPVVSTCGTCGNLTDFDHVPASEWAGSFTTVGNTQCVATPTSNPRMCLSYTPEKLLREAVEPEPFKPPQPCTCGGRAHVRDLQVFGLPLPGDSRYSLEQLPWWAVPDDLKEPKEE
mmetsp:Transcript_19933/g.48525  ORF Transcript_19933/g.48525 Transcript_19933/m.48525 type:complete len:411 (+) Transcript_19933:95-1327(+)